jgi:hypothetical protein
MGCVSGVDVMDGDVGSCGGQPWWWSERENILHTRVFIDTVRAEDASSTPVPAPALLHLHGTAHARQGRWEDEDEDRI